jgi:hypothetical protein
MYIIEVIGYPKDIQGSKIREIHGNTNLCGFRKWRAMLLPWGR